MAVEANECKDSYPKRHNKKERYEVIIGVNIVKKGTRIVLNAGNVGKDESGEENDCVNRHQDEAVKFGISVSHNAFIVPFYGGYGVH